MKFASRIEKVPPYLFVGISRKIAEKRAQGIDVISFGIGDPDIPTPENVVEKLRETALDSPNHRYPETDGTARVSAGSRGTGTSAGSAYRCIRTRRLCRSSGRKKGSVMPRSASLSRATSRLCLIRGYPVYSVGTWFRGAASATGCRLLEENGWMPDLDAIPG